MSETESKPTFSPSPLLLEAFGYACDLLEHEVRTAGMEPPPDADMQAHLFGER